MVGICGPPLHEIPPAHNVHISLKQTISKKKPLHLVTETGLSKVMDQIKAPLRQTHRVKVRNDTFEVDVRYTQLKLVGKGAYGSVAAALDTLTGRQVAIKKIKGVFEDDHYVKAKRILREIKLLRHFNEHENVITILDIMAVPQDTLEFHEVYIVCNLMESDLDQIIASPQPLSDQHYRYFLYQILRGLKYVHSANVVHRDLKPSNLLLNANCDLGAWHFIVFSLQATSTEPTLTNDYYQQPEYSDP